MREFLPATLKWIWNGVFCSSPESVEKIKKQNTVCVGGDYIEKNGGRRLYTLRQRQLKSQMLCCSPQHNHFKESPT